MFEIISLQIIKSFDHIEWINYASFGVERIFNFRTSLLVLFTRETQVREAIDQTY